MKRVVSLPMTEVEPTTMVVQGLIDGGLRVQEVFLQPKEKKMKVAIEEVKMDEVMVYEEENPAEGQWTVPHNQNVTVQIDVTQPLSNLRQMLEEHMQFSLAAHQFYFQDGFLLDLNKSLVEQCIDGEGRMHVNLEVKWEPGTQPKVNILNVWKTEDLVQQAVLQEQGQLQLQYVDGTADGDVLPVETAAVDDPVPVMQAAIPTTLVVIPEETKVIHQWSIHENFRREQTLLNIPFDPLLWTPAHVQYWIQWAVKEFGLLGVDVNNFQLDGQQLCNLTHPEFVNFIPSDPDNIFWTHLNLLKEYKFAAVLQKTNTSTTVAINGNGQMKPIKYSRPSIRNMNGNNGQAHLWQFLLELLTDLDKVDIISWDGDDGVFILKNTDEVSRLWGQRKNRPNMNYEKMSRALRFYYGSQIIEKVRTKQYAYKFVCDVEAFLGYSPKMLSHLINEAKKKNDCLQQKTVDVAAIQQQTKMCQTMYLQDDE